MQSFAKIIYSNMDRAGQNFFVLVLGKNDFLETNKFDVAGYQLRKKKHPSV